MTAAESSGSADGTLVPERGSPSVTALIIDYAGVLTVPVSEALEDWMIADGLDEQRFPAFMRDFMVRASSDQDGPVHGLEVGTWSAKQFERAFVEDIAAAGLGTVAADGLLRRMFGGLRPDPVMVDAVARVHAAGIPTALLSNAFGLEYTRDRWGELFDVTVISDEVGMRKPDPAIYRLTCQQLHVDPTSSVFVDDFDTNVAAAEALGMTGVCHVGAAATVSQLEALFDLRERDS